MKIYLRWQVIFGEIIFSGICTFLLSIAPCSNLSSQEVLLRDDLHEIINLPYHIEAINDSLRQLNLVLPINAKHAPLLVWVGGGAWSYVDRHQEMDLARKIAAQGIAVATIGHRLSSAIWRDSSLTGGHQHPSHIQDLAVAIKWLEDHAIDYDYDPNKMIVGGFSSGAQLVALLCSNLKYLREVDFDIKNLKGVIPISGTYDIQNYYEVFKNGSRPELATLHVESVFGPPEAFSDASPTHFVDHLQMPMLLISDHNMNTYTKLYENKMLSSPYRNFDAFYVQHLDHAELWRELSFTEHSIYRNHIVDFIRKHTQT